MAEETNADKNKSQENINPAPTGETKPTVNPVSQPTNTPPSKSDLSSETGGKKCCDDTGKSKEILVRVLEDDELKPFEAQTLFWAKVGFYLAITTLLIAVLTLIVFYNQLNVMQTQLQEAEIDSKISDLRARLQHQTAQAQVDAIKRQMRQDQRPWVALTFNWPLVKGSNGEIGKLVRVTENQPLVVPIRVINTGKTAARNIVAKIFVEVVKANDNPALDSSKASAWNFSAGIFSPNAPADSVAYRQQPKKIGLEAMSNLTPAENQELSSGRAYLAMHGEIIYKDIFDIPHWTKFCSWVPLSPIEHTYNAKKCSDYNDVDNN